MPTQFLGDPGLDVFSVQVVPELVELQMLPLLTAAVRNTPSSDMAMPAQTLTLPGLEVFSVQVAPESVELQMLPLSTDAARWVLSADMVTHFQFLTSPGLNVFLVQVAPESVELQMLPPYSTALRWVPSSDIAMLRQFLSARAFCVQTALSRSTAVDETAERAKNKQQRVVVDIALCVKTSVRPRVNGVVFLSVGTPLLERRISRSPSLVVIKL